MRNVLNFYKIKIESSKIENVDVKIYSPQNSAKMPLMIFYHGGAYVFGKHG